MSRHVPDDEARAALDHRLRAVRRVLTVADAGGAHRAVNIAGVDGGDRRQRRADHPVISASRGASAGAHGANSNGDSLGLAPPSELFARNQSAALFTVASGAIVVTSVPFWLKTFCTFIASLQYFRRQRCRYRRHHFTFQYGGCAALPVCQNGAASETAVKGFVGNTDMLRMSALKRAPPAAP